MGLFDKDLLSKMESAPALDAPTEKLHHYSVIFNAFVLLNVVN